MQIVTARCITIALLATLATVHGQPSSAAVATHTLSGIVIEQRADVKSVEAWNAPSDPYYVLDVESNLDGTGNRQESGNSRVTLRPSEQVTTRQLRRLKGERVQLQGHYVEGQPYQPADPAEQMPMEPEVRAKPDGTPEFTGWRPARRGAGFVVEAIRRTGAKLEQRPGMPEIPLR
ncbi:MAG: hypothetical protein EPN21_12560 [Methylococcaceae bacterium]|nr:MAG: hypothetical protein EPN21_12560 [Methylococcaceae bacterium]